MLSSLTPLLRHSSACGASALAVAVQHYQALNSISSCLQGSLSGQQQTCSVSTGSSTQPSQAPSFSEQPANLRAVFLGPPGVGKGTYASRIAKHLGVAHIATGDLIREEIKAQTSTGQQVTGGI